MGFSPYTNLPEFPIDRIYENVERREKRTAEAQSFVNTYVDKLWQIPTLDNDTDIAYKNKLVDRGTEELSMTLRKYRNNLNKAMPELITKMTDITTNPFWTKNAHALVEKGRATKWLDDFKKQHPNRQVYLADNSVNEKSVVNPDETFNDLGFEALPLTTLEEMAAPFSEDVKATTTGDFYRDPMIPFGVVYEEKTSVDKNEWNAWLNSQRNIDRVVNSNPGRYRKYLDEFGSDEAARKAMMNDVAMQTYPTTISRVTHKKVINYPSPTIPTPGSVTPPNRFSSGIPYSSRIPVVPEKIYPLDPQDDPVTITKKEIANIDNQLKAYEVTDKGVFMSDDKNKDIDVGEGYNRILAQREAKLDVYKGQSKLENEKAIRIWNEINTEIENGEHPDAIGKASIRKYTDNYGIEQFKVEPPNFTKTVRKAIRGASGFPKDIVEEIITIKDKEERARHFDMGQRLLDIDMDIYNSRGVYDPTFVSLDTDASGKQYDAQRELMNSIQKVDAGKILDQNHQSDPKLTKYLNSNFYEDKKFGGPKSDHRIYLQGIAYDQQNGRWLGDIIIQDKDTSGNWKAMDLNYEDLKMDITKQVNSQLTPAEKADLALKTSLFNVLQKGSVTVSPKAGEAFPDQVVISGKNIEPIKDFFADNEYKANYIKNPDGSINDLSINYPGGGVISYGQDINRAVSDVVEHRTIQRQEMRERNIPYAFSEPELNLIGEQYGGDNIYIQGSHEAEAMDELLRAEGYKLKPARQGKAQFETWGIGFSTENDYHPIPDNYNNIDKHAEIAREFGKTLAGNHNRLTAMMNGLSPTDPSLGLTPQQYAGIMSYVWHTGDVNTAVKIMTVLSEPEIYGYDKIQPLINKVKNRSDKSGADVIKRGKHEAELIFGK